MNIDKTIEADTLPVRTTLYSHIRLMNDSRWPWLILLPKDASITELHQLTQSERSGFLSDVNHCSDIMQSVTQCQSVNIAMLGNVVSALHCHVVARQPGDPNWPKPVWGFEQAIAYKGTRPLGLIEAVEQAFEAS